MAETTNVGEGRRVAIVGAGPTGFYASDQLLGMGFAVDLYDRLPTPFGLVRFGVAPDHPKIKSVTRMYEKTARNATASASSAASTLGDDITTAELRERYHAVALRRPAPPTDNRLGIPGEDRPGSYAATRFVAWYNGHPDACDEQFDLARHARGRRRQRQRRDRHRAHARARPRRARADRHGRPRARRRSPPRRSRRSCCSAAAARPRRPSPTRSCASSASSRAPRRSSTPPSSSSTTASRTLARDGGRPDRPKRNFELLKEYAARPLGDASHRITLRFLRSPVELLGEGEDGRVTGMRVVRNRIEAGDDGSLRAVPTDREEVIPLRARHPLDRLPRPCRSATCRSTSAAA